MQGKPMVASGMSQNQRVGMSNMPSLEIAKTFGQNGDHSMNGAMSKTVIKGRTQSSSQMTSDRSSASFMNSEMAKSSKFGSRPIIQTSNMTSGRSHRMKSVQMQESSKVNASIAEVTAAATCETASLTRTVLMLALASLLAAPCLV
jgi:hypothetical protein